jgi:hypothetical protein
VNLEGSLFFADEEHETLRFGDSGSCVSLNTVYGEWLAYDLKLTMMFGLTAMCQHRDRISGSSQ